jgi:hypothetical protein
VWGEEEEVGDLGCGAGDVGDVVVDGIWRGWNDVVGADVFVVFGVVGEDGDVGVPDRDVGRGARLDLR